MTKPTFRVRDKRTGEFTCDRGWTRISDVRQHLSRRKDVEHLEVVQFALVEQGIQNAADFMERRQWIENPVIRCREIGE